MGGEATDPSVGEPWYVAAFGPFYPLVYGHRTDAEAAAAVRLVSPLVPGGLVLDLACGAGRHLRALDAAGMPAVGLDLSASLLSEARRREPRARLVRGDLRHLPFRSRHFAAVLSFFTSFGYFDSPEEDSRVIEETRRVLGAGGLLALDLTNPAAALKTVGRSTERVIDGLRILEERAATEGGKRIEKRIRIVRPDGALLLDTTERVRLYSREDLFALLNAAGFDIIRLWGDYEGAPFGEEAPRLIVAATLRAAGPNAHTATPRRGG